LIAYFSAGSDAAALFAFPGVRVEREAVADVDWVARFRERFRAFDAGPFRIVPAWEAGTSPRDSRTLVVDPGRAFGTGTHETTRLCLAALARLAGGPGLGRVIDVGTGSGLLAIAALRLGASAAVGVDNDQEALRAAAHHAELNRAPLRLIAGDGGRPVRPGCFDSVLANLMAPLLLEKKAELDRLRSRRGRLVLSGLLQEDLRMLRDAYASAGALEELHEGEWAALIVGPPGT
jgi:ribosomal protein L11 methyltransferase